MLYYKRYIDDIYALCKSRSAANEFISAFNGIFPGVLILKTIHIESRGVFLDLEISITPIHSIMTCLYQKPSNKYTYIPPLSAHKPAIFRAFILEELKRYKRSCTLESDFLRFADLFCTRLRIRGYPQSLFNAAFKIITTPTTEPPVPVHNFTTSQHMDIDEHIFSQSLDQIRTATQIGEPEPQSKKKTDGVRRLIFVSELPAFTVPMPFRKILVVPENISGLLLYSMAFENSPKLISIATKSGKSIASYLLSSHFPCK